MLIKLLIESFKFSKLQSERFFRLLFVLLIAWQFGINYLFENYLPADVMSFSTAFDIKKIYALGLMILSLIISLFISILYSGVLIKEIRIKNKGVDVYKNLSTNVLMMPLSERSKEDQEYLQKLFKLIQMTPEERTEARILRSLQNKQSDVEEDWSATNKSVILSKKSQRSIFCRTALQLIKKSLLIMLFFLTMFFAMLVSAPLLFLIGFVYIFTFCFVPILLVAENKSLREAFRLSKQYTDGNRLKIFVITIFQTSLLLNINYLLDILFTNFYAVAITAGLLMAIETFARGRLFGLLYLLLADKKPIIPN